MTEKDFNLEKLLSDITDSNTHPIVDEDDIVVTNEADVVEKATETIEEKPKKSKKPKAEDTKVDDGTVALFSNGAIYQAKWGELAKGYNIVSKEAAEYWLSHTSRVRLATPEEVAKHYGVK